MRIHVRQIIAFAELGHPSGNAVGVHWLAVVLCKYKTVVFIVFSQPLNFGILPRTIFEKKLHRFRWERYIAYRSIAFERIFVYTTVGSI